METILYLAHTQEDGSLAKISLETLSAATELSKSLEGSSLMIGLVGKDVQEAANTISGCGATKIFAVQGEDFSSSRYASDIVAMEAISQAAKATLILAPSTSRLSRVLPGVAYRLEGRIDTRVNAWQTNNGTLQIERWYYRQRMVSTLTRKERPWFWLLNSGIAKPWSGDTGNVSVENISVSLENKKTRVVGIEAPSADEVTIRPDAEMLFVAGAGWTKKQSDGQPHIKEGEKLILDFLHQTKASLGSSKSLVDQSGEGQTVLSFLSHLNQIGQTGSTPRHPKGLATCCHGEEPHVVGWRFINERRAVNLDPNCGWAQGKTDVLYIADAFQVMEKVNQLLAQQK